MLLIRPRILKRRKRLLVAVVVALAATFGWPARAGAQGLTASMVYPANGALGVDLSQALAWTSCDGAQAYYLYLGSTLGAKDIVNTGELQEISYQTTLIPPNQLIYARLWTKVSGVWRSQDSTFTAAPLIANFVFPTPGTTDLDVTLPWSWTAVPNVQAYYLYVGSTLGAKDLLNSGELQTTTYQPTSLPTGRLLYARLWTKFGGAWRYADQIVSSPAAPKLTVPANGATGVDLAQPIRWTTVTDAEAYFLRVGSTPGADDLVNTGEIAQTSYTPTNLPGQQALYARIFAKVGGIWRYTDSTFSGIVLFSKIAYPANDAANADLALPIQWLAVPDAQAYYLYVGSTFGANDLINSGETQQASYPATSLPLNQTLYGRIWVKVGGSWRYSDSTFRYTGGLAPVLTYPVNGSTDADFGRDLRWTTVANADAYYLTVGSTAGGSDLVNTGETAQLSANAANLPPGQTLYATVWARVGGVWRSTESTFAGTIFTSRLIDPANGSAHADASAPITWTTVPDVQAYYLYVGSTSGAKDILDSKETGLTTWPTAGLPLNQVLYARIWAKVGGIWRYSDSTFTLETLVARVIYPADGATDVDRRNLITWTAVSNVDAYSLEVGTTLGGHDLLIGGETADTWQWMGQLPVDRILYLRLQTKIYGVWRYVDSTFTAEPLAAEFTQPLAGAVGVDAAAPFQWTPAIGAQAYRLIIGTTAGAGDLADSGEISGRSYVANGLPAAGLLYARVMTKTNGAWSNHSDLAFTLASSMQASTMVFPEADEANVDTRLPFEWTDAPLARAYRLTIGTTIGGSDLHDSGPVHVTWRFVPSLPVGVPLFGRIQTQIGGQWYPTDFSFTVSANTVSSALQIKSALRATGFIRSFAFSDNRPWLDTMVFGFVSPRYAAVCSDYAQALLQFLAETNSQAPSRLLNLSFTGTLFEAHTLVELLDADTQRWILLDPTFGVTMRRSDGAFATAEEVSQATLALDWMAVTYEPLGDAGESYLGGYYLDYPLLYVNVYHDAPVVVGQGIPTVPYLREVMIPSTGDGPFYLVRCLGTSAAQVLVDGSTRQVICDGADSMSSVFSASSVAAPSGGAPLFQLFTLKRFRF